jgi:hypothetical protein
MSYQYRKRPTRSSSILYETIGIEGFNKFTFKAISTLFGGFLIHCLVGA